MNKVQELFQQLIAEFELRAIEIDGETWYALNDLPLKPSAIREALSRLKNSNVTSNDIKNFGENNTRLIKNSNVISNDIKNFESPIANRGEKFGNYKIINYLIMSSKLGAEYKIKIINILDEIRQNSYYVDNNITEQQMEKLQKELDERNVMLRKVFGTNLRTLPQFVDIINQNSNHFITLNDLISLMKKLKWLNNKMEITFNGSTRKLVKYNDEILISEYGRQLILDNLSRAENKIIAKS